MKRYYINTPDGTHDKLFDECKTLRNIENGLVDVFSLAGYSEIVTPTAEYYDVFLRPGVLREQESTLKIIDRSGLILVLRPDMTTPIARVAATKLCAQPLPYRLFYVQDVFRSDTANAGRSMQIRQAGAELIGPSGVAADAEMIALAVEAIRACGIRNFHVEIGHAGFYTALAASLDFKGDTLESVRTLIEKKNFAALNELLRDYNGHPCCVALSKLPQLFGGYEVLDEALSLTNEPGAVRALAYLREIYNELAARGLARNIMIDLGIVHRLDYYTGVVFRGYAEGAGGTVLSGGRYDRLAASFGRELPATGFAIDLESLTEVIGKNKATAEEGEL